MGSRWCTLVHSPGCRQGSSSAKKVEPALSTGRNSIARAALTSLMRRSPSRRRVAWWCRAPGRLAHTAGRGQSISDSYTKASASGCLGLHSIGACVKGLGLGSRLGLGFGFGFGLAPLDRSLCQGMVIKGWSSRDGNQGMVIKGWSDDRREIVLRSSLVIKGTRWSHQGRL